MSTVGNTFTTTPPFPEPHPVTGPASPDLVQAQRVLIVEDHPDTAEMLRRWFIRKGVAADSVPTAPVAMDYLTKARPHCLVVDDHIPGPSGLDLLREVRSNAALFDLPVVFYSASFDDARLREAASLGAQGWFVKGISSLDELLASVTHMSAAGAAGASPLTAGLLRPPTSGS